MVDGKAERGAPSWQPCEPMSPVPINEIGGIELTGLSWPPIQPGRAAIPEIRWGRFATEAEHLDCLRWSEGCICPGESDATRTTWKTGVCAEHGSSTNAWTLANPLTWVGPVR
jgi:hypothetical protein